MANINQTIIVRTDIFNPDNVGLLAAQIAHIHFELARQVIIENLIENPDLIEVELSKYGELGADFSEWVKDPYLLVKKVGCLEALHHYQAEAINAKLPTRQWKDTVYVNLTPTVQKAFSDTLVGISIGPADADKIRTVVGDLPLL